MARAIALSVRQATDEPVLPRLSAVRMVEKQCAQLLGRHSEVYQCPITHELFRDPVMAMDGQTYEREAILEHFRQNPMRSPMTNEPLSSDYITDNLFCKMAVHEYKEAMLRGISDVLPFVDEMGDLEKAEALLRRAEECAASPEAARALRARWLQNQIAKATTRSLEAASDRLQDLIELDVVLASQAVSEMRNDVLVKLCSAVPTDAPGSIFVSHERLKRVSDQAVSAFVELLSDELIEVRGISNLSSALSAATEQVRSGLSELEEKTGMVVFSEMDALFFD